MSVTTFEGYVDEEGQIRLKSTVQLPRNARVYVVIPDLETSPAAAVQAHVYSPRLAHREDVADFTLEVSEKVENA